VAFPGLNLEQPPIAVCFGWTEGRGGFAEYTQIGLGDGSQEHRARSAACVGGGGLGGSALWVRFVNRGPGYIFGMGCDHWEEGAFSSKPGRICRVAISG